MYLNSLRVSVFHNTVKAQVTKKLYSKYTIQRHEEQEEYGHIIYLLAGSSVKIKIL